jgi:hypothetical protein
MVLLNDMNARDNGITDLLNAAPVIGALHATTASNGTNHKYIKQTGAPSPGFRAVNTGRANSTSGYSEVSLALALMDASFVVDVPLAQSYRYGAEAFVERESLSQLKQAFFQFEQQIWYGQAAGAAAGFVGFADLANYNAAAGSLVVNAGGTAASTGSSIWLIRSAPDETGVTAIIGNSGEIAIGDTVVTLKPDDTTPANYFPAYLTPITAYLALQVGGNYSAVRIGNITAETGHTVTDKLISQGISLFPAGFGPTHIAMSRRSLQQLQASRTATNPTGAPAPFPQDAFNIPIIPTDSISNTETLLT